MRRAAAVAEIPTCPACGEWHSPDTVCHSDLAEWVRGLQRLMGIDYDDSDDEQKQKLEKLIRDVADYHGATLTGITFIYQGFRSYWLDTGREMRQSLWEGQGTLELENGERYVITAKGPYGSNGSMHLEAKLKTDSTT